MLEKHPKNLVEAKVVAREVDQLDKDYERLWRREDDSIRQFIPIRPRALGERQLGRRIKFLTRPLMQVHVLW